MIRPLESPDIDEVLEIWLKASLGAHSFVAREFWESKLDAMRQIYLPASETYVFTDHEIIQGFLSLQGDMLAALFVSPACQGQGIGRELMQQAKTLRKRLYLTVYRQNHAGIEFYKKCGFTVVGQQVDAHTGQDELVMEYNAGRHEQSGLKRAPSERNGCGGDTPSVDS